MNVFMQSRRMILCFRLAACTVTWKSGKGKEYSSVFQMVKITSLQAYKTGWSCGKKKKKKAPSPRKQPLFHNLTCSALSILPSSKGAAKTLPSALVPAPLVSTYVFHAWPLLPLFPHLLSTSFYTPCSSRACSSLALMDLALDAASCFAGDGLAVTGHWRWLRCLQGWAITVLYSVTPISYSWFSFHVGGEQLLLWLSSQLVKPWWPSCSTTDVWGGKRTFEYLLMVWWWFEDWGKPWGLQWGWSCDAQAWFNSIKK